MGGRFANLVRIYLLFGNVKGFNSDSDSSCMYECTKLFVCDRKYVDTCTQLFFMSAIAVYPLSTTNL